MERKQVKIQNEEMLGEGKGGWQEVPSNRIKLVIFKNSKLIVLLA